jgi:hypothetical protein
MKTKKSLKKGIDFIFSKQKDDGSFWGLTSSSKNFDKAIKRETIFPTCLILSNLSQCDKSLIRPDQKLRIVNFLLGQKSENGSFNYWKRGSTDEKNEPYPDDLDDTFCALAAIHEFDHQRISDESLMNAITLLTLVEKKEGGPYFTWLVNEKSSSDWKDVDLAVNSNVAYFLSLQEISLESINSLIRSAVSKKDFSSPYYHSIYSVLYFISRFYQCDETEKIIDFVLKKRGKDFSWGNALDTSLSCLTLLNFGVSEDIVKPSVLKIASLQNKDGSWDALPFVVEKIEKNVKYYSGSKELTTSFCVRAISDFVKKKSEAVEENQKKDVFKTKEALNFEKKVLRKTQKIVKELEGEIKIELQNSVDNVIESEKMRDEIILLLFHFQKVLKKRGCDVGDSVVVDFGVVSVLGWVAYGLYDDIIDGERGVENVSLANTFLRELTVLYSSVAKNDKRLMRFFCETMHKVECANFRETRKLRVDVVDGKIALDKKMPKEFDKSFLFDRSRGHFLGIGSMILLAGNKKNSKEFVNMFLFFKHYIIAKQLNDDMHDWEEDMRKGCVTQVIVSIARSLSGRSEVDVENDLDEMRGIFWNDVVVDVCDDIDFHVKKAHDCLLRIGAGGKTCFFGKLLFSLKEVTERTKKERGEVLGILQCLSEK